MKKLILIAVSTSLLLGGQDGLDLTPAPTSQMQTKAGDMENRVRLTAISASYGDYDIAGAAVQGGHKEGKEWGATNLSGSFLSMSGGDDTSDAALISGNLSYLFEKYTGTEGGSNLTLFAGPDVTFTYLNVNQDSGTEVDVYMTLYGALGGLQYNIHTPGIIISPFFIATYLTGSATVDIYPSSGYAYSSTEDVDPILSQSFGFDLYFKSIDASLSAMVKSDDNVGSTMVSFAWFW